jgi:hypothetical protein
MWKTNDTHLIYGPVYGPGPETRTFEAPKKKATNLFTGAKTIFKEEGLFSLIKRGLVFIAGYENKTFFLYECKIRKHDKANEKIFLPRPKNYCLKIISSSEQIEDLIDEGFDISYIAGDRRFELKKPGSLEFLLFVEKELAAIGLIAITAEAKNSFNPQRYKVDFTHGEVCGGAVFTVPGFMAKNLVTFLVYSGCEYLAQTDTKVLKCIIETKNTTMQKIFKKVYSDCQTCTRAHYLKIFGFKIWREHPDVSLINDSNLN